MDDKEYFILYDGSPVLYSEILAKLQEYSIASSIESSKSLLFNKIFRMLEDRGVIDRSNYKTK